MQNQSLTNSTACAGGYPELPFEISDDVCGLVDGNGGEDVSYIDSRSSFPVDLDSRGNTVGPRERDIAEMKKKAEYNQIQFQ
jgi:hypothetical protein